MERLTIIPKFIPIIHCLTNSQGTAAVLSTPSGQPKQKQTKTGLGVLEFCRCFIAQAKGILRCKNEEGGSSTSTPALVLLQDTGTTLWVQRLFGQFTRNCFQLISSQESYLYPSKFSKYIVTQTAASRNSQHCSLTSGSWTPMLKFLGQYFGYFHHRNALEAAEKQSGPD